MIFPPEGYGLVNMLYHSRKEVLWMDFALMIILIVVIATVIIIYPKRDTFIEKFKLKGSYKCFELEISTKQKNDPPDKSDRSNLK